MNSHLIILSFLFAFSFIGCSKCNKEEEKFKGNYKTPISSVKAYIWSVNHSHCEQLGKSLTGDILRFFKRPKHKGRGCFYIINSYTRDKSDKTMNANVKPAGEIEVIFEDKDRAVVAYPLHRKGRDETAYFDLKKTEGKWLVNSENKKFPQWCTKCKHSGKSK
ncbi:MAG: hypothetical protein PF689_02490 [Deltaproteobacteria bacterium]|jgi:hypothetical protein|nr:hypothetical protein [Deltaproteobacteria bacterium]